MQFIADNGLLKENESSSFFPLVDSLRFEVKFKVCIGSSYFIRYYCCLGWSGNIVHVKKAKFGELTA